MSVINYFINLANQVTGELGLANGGTNANLSATGGTSEVLKQVSSGAAITVAQLATTDLSDVATGAWTPTAHSISTTGTVTYVGKYTKINNIVFLTLTITTGATSSATITGNSTNFTGLPYAPTFNSPTQQITGADTLSGTGLIFASGSAVYPATASVGASTTLTVQGWYIT